MSDLRDTVEYLDKESGGCFTALLCALLAAVVVKIAAM
jgi:hypothetical protein